MGSIEFIKLNTGERSRIDIDGTVIKDQVEPPRIEWCDRCEAFKGFAGGRYEYVQGLEQIWICELCK